MQKTWLANSLNSKCGQIQIEKEHLKMFKLNCFK